jgi:hypothetical protein
MSHITIKFVIIRGKVTIIRDKASVEEDLKIKLDKAVTTKQAGSPEGIQVEQTRAKPRYLHLRSRDDT